MRAAAVRVLTAALAAFILASCGAPSPVTGTNKAKPAKQSSHPPATLVASPESVSQALVAAWAKNDRVTIGQLTTETARAELLKRPFPSVTPTFVNCQPAPRVAGGQTCLFQADRQQFSFIAQQRNNGWLVTDARFEAP